MASDFTSAYLAKREKEKKQAASGSSSGSANVQNTESKHAQTSFSDAYLAKRYNDGALADRQAQSAVDDIGYDPDTGKWYSISWQNRKYSASKMNSALDAAQSMQKEADRYSNILMREPESGVLMPDYDAIRSANTAQEQLRAYGIRRHEAENALKQYQTQYGSKLDQYGPFIDSKGRTIQEGMGALQMEYDQANQAYEDAFADYQKKQQAADYARRQDDKRKALQNEWAQYKQMQADKSKAETDAVEAWKSYYSMLPRAEDFASNQQNAYASRYGQRVDSSDYDSDADGSAYFRDFLMTDEELAIMTYLRNTQGDEAARRYEDSLRSTETERKEQQSQRFGMEHPVLASAGSVGLNIANEIEGPVGIVKAKLNGQELDPDADYFRAGKMRDAMRAGVMQDMSPFWRDIYQTLMSAVADSGANALFSLGTGIGWVGAGLTGLSGFTDMTRQIKERNGSDTQALVLGAIEGIAEVVTEKMGFDRMADMLTNKVALRAALQKALSSSMSEFGEESITTVINQAADLIYGIVSGEETEFTKLIDHYREESVSDGEAFWRTLLDMGGDTLMDGLGGALGGLVNSGLAISINKGAGAIDNVATKVENKIAEWKFNRETKKAGQASQIAQEDAQARQNAQVTENQPIAGNRVQTAQEAETRARIERLAQETADAEMGEQAARQEMRQTEQQRVRQTTRQAAQTTENASAESVHNAAAVYGRDAASFESHYEGGTLQNYRRAFDAVYQAGKVNLSLEQVNQAGGEIVSGLSEQAKAEIWQAGRNAAASVVVPGVSKQYVGKMNHNQRAQIRILDAIGKKYGIQIDVVSSLDYGRTAGNAALVGRNHIVVASDAMNSAYVQAGVHELVHNLRRESSAYYDAFSSVVLDTLKKDGSFDLQAAIAERIRQYAEQGQQLSQEDALEEIVAEAAPAALTNREAMRAFVNENRSLAEKVRDFFVRFADELRQIAAKYGAGNSRAEVDAMLRADAQDLVNIAESLDMALSAAQERGGAEGAATAQRAQTQSTGIELQSLTNYSLKDRNVIEGYLDAVDQEVLEAAQTYREDKNAKFRRIKLGDVQQREAETIKKLTGKDVSGYTHNIDRNGFVHIENRHGTNGTQDQSMSDLNDVARQGWVIENYDDIGRLKDRNGEYVDSYGYLDANGEPSPVVVYRKRINGTYYLVEAVADGRWKKLWTVSAYISDKKIDASWTSNASFETPNFTSETGSTAASVTIVAESGDIVNPSAEISSEARELSDADTKFSLREKEPPEKTLTAYKVFVAFENKPGQLFPPMVANPNGESTPVGVWLDADEGVTAKDKNGNELVNTLGRKQVKSGGKGTQGGSGALAYRPGWHLGELPIAKQFSRVNPETGVKELFPANFIWAECEIAADRNYQEEAMSYGYNKNGKFQHSLAGLPKLPTDGYYMYRTNPDPTTLPWYITGAMKVTKILSDAETDQILRDHGIEPMKRQGGPIDLEKFGFKAGEVGENGTKFSLKSPVEETKDLVAVHNLTESKLQKALELGGFPMPSIAVTRTDVGHQTFGDISLVFGRETIDPKANRKNVVYSADAWTPTFPTIEYQADNNVHSRAYTKLNELARSLPSEYQKDIHMFINDPDYQLQRYGGESGLIDAAMENRGIRAAYASETGHDVTMETRTETKGGVSPRAAARYEKILAIFDNDVERMTHMPIDQMIDQYGDKLFEIIPMRRMLPDFISNTAKFARGELEARQVQVEDLAATDKKISAMIEESGLRSWVKQLFSGIEGKRGVYNNKERFTASGNRRSFDATHYPATLENIAKAMAEQNGGNSKNVSGFNGVKTLRAGLSETLNSVKSMHEREGRIQQLTQERVDEATSRLNDELYALIEEIVNTKGKSDYDSLRAYDYAGGMLMEIAETRYSAESIRSTFAKYGEQINEQTAQKVKNLLDRIADMPVDFFEAKPQRAVYFDEVKAAIIPESTSESLKSELKERVGQVIEYADGDEQARLEALNSLEEVKFSLKNTSEVDEQAKALMDGVDVEYNAEVVQAYARSALRAADKDAAKINQQVRQAAGKILKDTASKYDRRTLESNMRAIVEAYARDGGDGVSQAAAEMAKAIIEKNTHLDTTLRDQYSALRRDLRENGVSLTESQKAEAASIYGSYNEFRRALMGTVKLTDKSMTLEARWDELSMMYPEIFHADTVEGDQINALMAFKQMMQPVYTNDFGMDMDTAAVDLGLRIQGDALSIAGAKEASKQLYGSAQKIESRVKKAYDAELKAQKKAKVAQFQEIAERLAEAKKLGDTQGYDSAMADYRKLIRKETGVKMPGGEGMSPSAKMRFSQLAEDMQAAREANDTAAYQRAFADYRALLKKERIASTVVAPAVQDALNQARARFKANQEAKEGTVKKQKATQRVIKQAKALVDMLGNKKKGVRVPRMMQDSLLTLLEGLDINGRSAANKGELTQQAAAMREQLTALRQTYQAIWNDQAKGEAPAVLDGLMMVINEEQRAQLDDALSILEQGGRFTLRSMTTEQLKALGDALMTVKQTISTIGVLWRKGRYNNVAELADASIQEMGKRPDAKLNAAAGLNAGRDFLALDMLEPVSYGERLGQAGSEIIQGLYEGERAKFGRLREAQTAAAAMMKDTDVTSYDIGRWRSHVNTVRMGGHDVKLTDTQAMDIYLTAMRPQGKQHMLGNGIRLKTSKQTGAQVFTVRMTEADIAKVSDLLSDQQKRMAHKLQGYLAGDVAKWGNDVTQQLYLYDYFTEKTYWPLTSDPNVLKSKEPTADFRLDALTNPGFIKPLKAGANNAVIIMDAFDVFNRHVAEMASYSGLAMPMIDAVNYLNYQQHDDAGLKTGGVKESMERLLGTGGQKYMTRLLQDLNHARHGDDLLALSKLGALYKKAAVTGKIRVVLQQPTAIARAAQEISPVYLAQGLKLGNKADIAEMEQHSALAWWKNNGSGMDIGVGRSADQVLWGNTSKAQTAMDKIETAGGLIDANRADAVTWAAMWRAVKRETQRIHPELQVGSEAYFRTVAERFDGIMDKTQVVDSVMHRSQIMRSQNGLVKELTAFKAEPIKSYNMLARAAMELGRNPKSRAAQTAATRSVLVFAANAALTALAEALFDVFKHRDDDDRLMEYLLNAKNGFLKEYTDEFLGSWLDNMNVIDLIPFATQAKDVLLNNDAPEMMSFEGLVSLRKAALTFNDHFVGENKQKTTTYGAIAPVLKAASQITGLPIAGIMANTEMLAKIADPQWLNYKAVSGKFADNYEALYAAILEGDKRAITRIRGRLAADTQGKSAKSPAQIDQGVANVLAEKDERIAQAYQLRKEGKSTQLVALKKQIMEDGFTDAMVSAAINRYESQAKAQEKTTQEKDMDAQLTAKLFNYENLYAAMRTGSVEDVGIIAEYLQANSTAKDPAAAIRGQVSDEFKQEYLDAVMNGGSAESLKKKLLSLGLTEDDLNGWVKDARYAELKESVGEGDIADAKQAARELIDSGADVSNVVKSLNSKYRPLYIELVNSGRTAEAEKLQKDLESLGLIKKKTGQNYYRKDYMDKWVTDYNDKNK